MSSFNAEQFLQTRKTGSLDTKLPVIPVAEYRGQIEKIAAREQEVKKGDRKGETVVFFDVLWSILDERLQKSLNMEKVTCRQSIFLDLTPEGQLDMGKAKNVGLGRLREAVHQNDPKKEWFPNMLIGTTAIIRVDHQPNEDDPDSPYSKVVAVAPIGQSTFKKKAS